MSAAKHYKLDNLCAVMIDVNGLQIDGATPRRHDRPSRWTRSSPPSAGTSSVCNGHDSVADLDRRRSRWPTCPHCRASRPASCCATTTKGLGRVSFMENNAGDWHGKAPNDEEYAQAMAEVRAAHATLELEGEFNDG